MDIVGKKYGHLTVIGLDEIKSKSVKGRYDKYWRCICDCGKETSVVTFKLKSGHTKSCGHIMGENTKKAAVEKAKKKNTILKDYGNYSEISLNEVKTLIDNVFLENIMKFNWLLSKAGYLFRHVHKGETVWLHRFVMGLPHKENVVDHRNHDSLDNRCENLRVCNETENAQNTVLRKDNSTGYKGVHAFNGKFRAKINVYGKNISLGLFDTVEQAHDAYSKAAKHYFGEFACTG